MAPTPLRQAPPRPPDIPVEGAGVRRGGGSTPVGEPERRGVPRLVRHLLVSSPVLVALLVVLVGGYLLHWSWTGYQAPATSPPSGPETRTLWDWLEVSLLPLTLALLPVWLKSRVRRGREWVVAVSIVTALLAILVVGGYALGWTWTGFTGNTLWDWLRLFLVPFAVPVAFQFLAEDGQTSDAQETPAGTVGTAPSERKGYNRTGARAVTWVAVAAVAWVVVMAAMFTSAGLRHVGGSGNTAGGPTTSNVVRALAVVPPSTVVRSITVSSRDPLWTPTGLRVVPGEKAEIAAFGMVLPSHRRGYHYVSPAGLTPSRPGQLSIDRHIRHAALIARVGVPGHPAALSQTRPHDVIAIGEHRTVTFRSTGELLLGLNDKKTADNTGWFGAVVTVPGKQTDRQKNTS